MLFRDRTTKSRISREEIQFKFPNTVVPFDMDAAACDLFGVDVVTPTPQPECDPQREYIVPAPDVLVNGAWTQAWTVKANGRTEEDIANDAAAALEAQRKAMVVTPWQIRKALNTSGLRASVEAAVKAGSQDLKDAWEFALDFKRLDPLVISLGAALGISDVELDELFNLAATL